MVGLPPFLPFFWLFSSLLPFPETVKVMAVSFPLLSKGKRGTGPCCRSFLFPLPLPFVARLMCWSGVPFQRKSKTGHSCVFSFSFFFSSIARTERVLNEKENGDRAISPFSFPPSPLSLPVGKKGPGIFPPFFFFSFSLARGTVGHNKGRGRVERKVVGWLLSFFLPFPPPLFLVGRRVFSFFFFFPPRTLHADNRGPLWWD